MPRYGEINPGLFTVVTFPYEFGFMFGDLGHGLVLFVLSLILFKAKSKLLSDLIGNRYLFLFMSIMTMFCGLVYNDFLGIPLRLFGSCYERQGNKITLKYKGCKS